MSKINLQHTIRHECFYTYRLCDMESCSVYHSCTTLVHRESPQQWAERREVHYAW